MSMKRRPNRNKTNRRSDGFMRTTILSALTAFAVAIYALVPEWREYIPVEQWVDELTTLARTTTSNELSPTRDTIPPPSAVGSALLQTQFADCPQFFLPGDMPQVPAAPGLRELCFTSFAILHSGETKTPVFVAQRLNRQMLQQAQKIGRKDRFYEESRLPARERAQLSDYRGSGYSRGHMAPAADMDNDQAMAQSFSLANMVPQDQRHNGGAWSQVEQDTRKYVTRAQGDVFVFTGPFYTKAPDVIGAGKVAVPPYIYKVLYDPTTQCSWVHWHTNAPETRMDRPISYPEFVRRTGLRLLPVADVKYC